MRTSAAFCLTMKGAPLKSQQSRRCACACKPAALDMAHYSVAKGGPAGV